MSTQPLRITSYEPLEEDSREALKIVSYEPPTFSDHLESAASNFWDQVNPVKAITGLRDTVNDLPGAIKAYGQQNQRLAQRAEDAFKSGDYAGAVSHALHYILNGVPGVGATLDEASDQAKNGDIGGALGKTAGLAAAMIAPSKVPTAVKAIGDAASKVAEVSQRPGVATAIGQGLGAAAGGAAGHFTGVPGASMAGAIVGREIGRDIASELASQAKDGAPVTPVAAAPSRYDLNVPYGVQRTPAWAGTPDLAAAPPAAEFAPQAPTSTISGRRVPTMDQRIALANEPSAASPVVDAASGEVLQRVPGTGPGLNETEFRTPPKKQARAAAPKVAEPEAADEETPAPAKAATPTPEKPAPAKPSFQQAAGDLAEELTGSREGIKINAAAPSNGAAIKAAYQAKRAQIIADHLHDAGISYQQASEITPENISEKQWQDLLGKDPTTGHQYGAPSKETLDQAVKLLAKKYAVSRSAKAMGAAMDLAKEMSQ